MTTRITNSATSIGRRAATAIAATVGASIAFTALASPASAEEPPRGKVWNDVAECESNQNWDIDTGNGYYGGLQFTDSTWDAYGGEKYAGRADHASRPEQIEVARRVLDDQGPGAWPVCSKKAGLTRATGDSSDKKLPKHAYPAPAKVD